MRYPLLAIAVLMLTGCTSTRVVGTDEYESSAYAEINEQAQRRMARLLLADGHKIKATSLQVMADSVSYVDADGKMRSVATDEIERVTFVRRWRGALQGIGIGVLTAGGGGALVGLMTGLSCGVDDWFCGPGFNMFVYGMTFGALGGQVGLIVGTVRGSRKVYRFTPADQQPAGEQGDAPKDAPK